MPKTKTPKIHMSIRLSAEARRWLTELAQAQGRSQSNVVEAALERYHEERMKKMEMINCRQCGFPVATWEVVKAAVKAEYNYSDAELDTASIGVFHPNCAVSAEQATPEDEFPDGFYWDVRLPR